MIYAIVPAAGQSTRMGQPKLILPLAGRSVLEHVVSSLRAGGVDHVLVVAGPHVPGLPLIAALACAHVCLLQDATADMRATVERGFDWLAEIRQPRPADSWILAPADHPTLNPEIVRRLIGAAGSSGRSIVVPTHNGRRGHPTLFSWTHVSGIRALPRDQGINAYLRSHASDTFELPVEDAEILADLDTPADLVRLQLKLTSRPG